MAFGLNCSVVLYDAMASEPNAGLQIYAALFVLSWLFIAKIIFFDLIVAVLVESFEVAETMKLIGEPGHTVKLRNMLKIGYYKLSRLSVINAAVGADNNAGEYSPSASTLATLARSPQPVHTTLTNLDALSSSDMILLALTELTDDSFNQRIRRKSTLQDYRYDSLYVFGPSNPFRQLCTTIKQHMLFQCIIYVSIFISCVLVILTPPAEDVPLLQSPISLRVRTVLDMILTFIFSFELFVSVVSQVFLLSSSCQ